MDNFELYLTVFFNITSIKVHPSGVKKTTELYPRKDVKNDE